MIYDKKYYDNLKKQHEKTAKFINETRWNFVKDIPFLIVLDYGCGCGELTTYAPQKEGLIIDSYDIGIINGSKYPQTGIKHSKYDLVFFDDVIEHVDWEKNPDELMEDIFQRTSYIFVSIPVWNKSLENISSWKHFKPGEHLTIFSEASIESFFFKRGFDQIKKGYPECPPRTDIFSAIYKKRDPK